MTRKKIAIIGLKGLPAFGGAANVGESLIEQMALHYDFTVYATASHTAHTGNYKGARQIVFKKFPIKSLNVFYYYIRSAIHAVFREKYDLVHLHHMDAAFIMLLLRLKYKVVATSHGLPYKTGKWKGLIIPYFKLNEWLQARLSNHLTVVAKSLVPHYSRMVSVKRISYISNGISIRSDITEVPERNDHILFAAGRIIQIKGLHLLLRALRKMNYPGKLVILGDLNQIKSYSELVTTLSEGLNIEFKGIIKDRNLLNRQIASARLFVFPSTQEAMSMMLLEVALFKTPIVCSDIVQNKDVFNEQEVAFFKSGSVDDLADKIQMALENPAEMEHKAREAFAKLENKFQWSQIAMEYDAVYRKLMGDSDNGESPKD